MRKRLVHRNKVEFGWLIKLLLIFVSINNIVYFFYLSQLILKSSIVSTYIVLLTLVPIFFINALLFPIYRTLWNSLQKKSDFFIYTTGLHIRGHDLDWKEIKSISFNTGRPTNKGEFYKGKKLPVFQEIYVLDNEGKEYSCIIDIDYFLKSNREENNLRKIKELLYGMDKLSLLSDWAEK